MQIDVIWPGDLAEHLVDLNDYGGDRSELPTALPGHRHEQHGGRSPGGVCPGSPMPGCSTTAPTCWRSMASTARRQPGTNWTRWRRRFRMASAPRATRTSGAMSGRVNAYEGLTCDALEWVYSSGGGTIVSRTRSLRSTIDAAADLRPGGQLGRHYLAPWRHRVRRGRCPSTCSRVAMPPSCATGPMPIAWAMAKTARSWTSSTSLPCLGQGWHRRATLGGWQLAVSKYSKNAQAAADLALFLASAGGAEDSCHRRQSEPDRHEPVPGSGRAGSDALLWQPL